MNQLMRLAWIGLAGAQLWQPARGAEPAKSPFDGEWLLQFRVRTNAGGASFTTRQGMEVSPYNFNFRAPVESFHFQDDRRVQLDEREGASLDIRSTSRFSTITVRDRQHHQGQIRLQGAGFGDADERRLRLSIRWGLLRGAGITSDNFGTSQSHRARMSDDGTMITLANDAGSRTLKFELWQSDWELRPASIEQREICEEVIEERTTYRGRRESRINPLDPGGFSPALPVTEEIELIQVRHLRLVPRG